MWLQPTTVSIYIQSIVSILVGFILVFLILKLARRSRLTNRMRASIYNDVHEVEMTQYSHNERLVEIERQLKKLQRRKQHITETRELCKQILERLEQSKKEL